MAVEKVFVTLQCHIALIGFVGRHNGKRLALFRTLVNRYTHQKTCIRNRRRTLSSWLNYTPLYIDQESELFWNFYIYMQEAVASRPMVDWKYKTIRLTLSFYALTLLLTSTVRAEGA